MKEMERDRRSIPEMLAFNRKEIVCLGPKDYSQFEEGSVVDFYYKSARNELVRFLPNAFQFTFKTSHVVDDATVSADPVGGKPAYYYLDPRLGGSALIKDVEVRLDNQLIPQPPIRGFQPFYQAINRSFAPNKVKRDKYDDYGSISNSDENKTGSAETKEASSFLVSGDGTSVDFRYPKSRWGYDGIFPISDQTSLLCASLFPGTYESNTYLPPDLDIHIRLFLSDSFRQHVQYAGFPDGLYFKNDALSQAQKTTNFKDVGTIAIQNIQLVFERVELDESQAQKNLCHLLKNSPVHYIRHFPYASSYNVTPNITDQEFQFHVFKGTQIFALAFPYLHQSVYNPTAGKTLSQKLYWPDNLEKLEIFSEKKTLLFELNNAGVADARDLDDTCRNYYHFLKSNNIFPKSFEHLFSKGKHTYEAVILLNLVELGIGQTNEFLTVKAHWTGSGKSPAGLNLLAFGIKSDTVVYDAKQHGFQRWVTRETLP